jgi:predicted transcriptional regulator
MGPIKDQHEEAEAVNSIVKEEIMFELTEKGKEIGAKIEELEKMIDEQQIRTEQ